MNKSTLSRLLQFKDPLTLPEVARRLSEVFGEQVTEADILWFALDKKITLSVDIVNTAKAEEVVWGDDGNLHPANNNDEVCLIRGIWDVLMGVTERKLIEAEYRRLLGHPPFRSFGLLSLPICLQKNNQGIYKLLEPASDNDSAPGLALSAYRAARSFPADAIFVVRSNSLREFEQLISENESEKNAKPQQTELSGAERNNLLKQIGALALILAEKSNRYKKGNVPSASAIAESVIEIIESLPDANSYGLGKSSIRKSISAGLKLISK